MRPYLAILRARFGMLLQYRAAAKAGIATQIFWGVIWTIIVQTFYGESKTEEPITLSQAIAFIWIGQALLRLLPWDLDKEVEAQVKSGQVAYALLRPLDLYGQWFFRGMAMRIAPTFLRCLPVFLVAFVFYHIPFPTWIAGMAFMASLFMAILLSTAITTLVIASLFWTISGEGIQRMMPHITVLLSGMLVPLPLFPDWMQPFLNLQPFRGIIDIPVRLYLGIIPVKQIILYLFFQLGWTLVFVLLGKWLMTKAIRQFVIEGG